MPPAQARKSTKEAMLAKSTSNVSGELGVEEEVKLTASGRPMRRGAGKRGSDPNYVDSTSAIHDSLGDLIEETKEMLSNTRYGKKRANALLKRPRSPSPPPMRIVECPSESYFTSQENTPAPDMSEEVDTVGYQPITLTFNIPVGFTGPLQLQLDPAMLIPMATPSPLSQRLPMNPPPFKRFKYLDEPTFKPKRSRSAKKIAKYVQKHETEPRGFCDLPAELRNIIYKMVFVAPDPIDFGGARSNFQHSGQFLRTCKKIHFEGSSFLYQDNGFVFRRNRGSRNPFWACNNKEVGYLDMRHFLTMIGTTGRRNLRRIIISFDEPTRQVAAELADGGRYMNDANLLEALKLIARECFLKRLGLIFYGRRHLSTFDVRFLEHLCAIEADDTVINPFREWTGDKIENRCKEVLYSEMIRREPLYPEERKNKSKTKSTSFWAR